MHIFRPHKDRPEHTFKVQVLKMIDVLTDEGTQIDGMGMAPLAVHELAKEIKTVWDTTVTKKAADAAKEKQDQKTMQHIEEVS